MVLLEQFNFYSAWFVSISITWFFESFIFHGGRGWVKGLGQRLSREKGFVAFAVSMGILSTVSTIINTTMISPFFTEIGILGLVFISWYGLLLYLGFSYRYYGRTNPTVSVIWSVVNLLIILALLNSPALLDTVIEYVPAI